MKLHRDIEKVLIPNNEIIQAVGALGARITADYEGKNLVVVGILKGAVVFFADLIRAIDVPLRIDFMATSSYGSATQSSGVVRILKDLEQDILDQHVLIVEDIVDTGLTLAFLKKNLADRGAASIRVAALLDKPERRKVNIQPDYCCFAIPDEFVVGYGLDYAQRYRNLPDIGILRRAVYAE